MRFTNSEIELGITSKEADLLLEAGLLRAKRGVSEVRECLEDGDMTAAGYCANEIDTVLSSLEAIVSQMRVYHCRQWAKHGTVNE